MLDAPIFSHTIRSIKHQPISPLLLRCGHRLNMSIGRGYRGSILPSGCESRIRHGVPRHIHTREDEAYFVLAGELEVIVGDEKFVLRAGDTLMAPRGIPHQLRNSGDIDNHYLLVFSPAGFEEFVRMTALPAPDDAIAPTEPAVAIRNVHELAAEYGIKFD